MNSHCSAPFAGQNWKPVHIYSSKDECLSIFAMLAEQHGLPISRPKFGTIAWDYLIGAGSISPRDWVVNKYKDFKKQQKQGALTTEELVPVLHIPSDNGCCNKGEIGYGSLVALNLDTRELLVQTNIEGERS